MIKQYRKKPVVIEAMKHEGGPMAWYNAHKFIGDSLNHYNPIFGDETSLYIETLEGRMECRVGDYIIKGIKGEFYPCKPDIFEATYDEVKN